MNEANQPSKIAFVSDYVPRRCGIATFTQDLRDAVAAQYPEADCGVLTINDVPEGYDYGPEVRFEIGEQRLRDYQEAVNFLRFNGFEVICLQHEFGIYGGRSGSHILAILREVDLPVVTTLHTILEEPAPDQRRVMDEIVRQSERLVVMTERGRRILREIHGAPAAKIDLIAHGIPDTLFVDPSSLKDQFGVEGKKVLLTFGLLSPGKGIEYVIRALPRDHPAVSGPALHRARRDPSAPPARGRRKLPAEPGASG
jgi:glycosyltransferase involved in cell wall biosynthesis